MQEDAQLLHRVAAGEPDAMEQLIARHQQALLARLKGIVRDSGMADDLLQETFMRVWTRAEQWRGGSVGGWLATIATNLALNHLRAVRRRRDRLPPAWPTHMLDGDADDHTTHDPPDRGMPLPVEQLEMDEDLARLRELVSVLPPEKRLVVSMVYDRQMDLKAVAEELNIPLGTVKSRLHYAVRHLTHKWQEDEST
jgi:RNA polymerase sigma-70 factor (ECF subfamily)